MFKTKKWTLVSVLAVVALAIAGVWLFGGTTIASAAGARDASVQFPPVPGGPRGGGRFNPRGGPGFPGFKDGDIDHTQLLADALGISVEDLQAAREAANEAGIAQAVEKGLITQERADAMQAERELHEKLMGYIDHDVLLAKALGMTPEALQAAFDDGKTLPELLESLDLDAATLHEKLAAAHEEALAQAVADGVITQEQADEMQQHFGDRGRMPGGMPRGRMTPFGGGENPRGRSRFPNRAPAVEGRDG